MQARARTLAARRHHGPRAISGNAARRSAEGARNPAVPRLPCGLGQPLPVQAGGAGLSHEGRQGLLRSAAAKHEPASGFLETARCSSASPNRHRLADPKASVSGSSTTTGTTVPFAAAAARAELSASRRSRRNQWMAISSEVSAFMRLLYRQAGGRRALPCLTSRLPPARGPLHRRDGRRRETWRHPPPRLHGPGRDPGREG